MNISAITAEAAWIFGVEEEQIYDETRLSEAVAARYAVILICAQDLHWNNSQIARAIKRNHATVAYAIRQAKARYQNDSVWREQVEELRQVLAYNQTIPAPPAPEQAQKTYGYEMRALIERAAERARIV